MNALTREAGEVLAQRGFSTLLETFNNANSIGTDDVIAACLPLLQQAADIHETGRVAPLVDPDRLGRVDGCLCFKTDDALEPRTNPAVVERRRKKNSALHIVDEVALVVEEADNVILGGSKLSATDRNVAEEQTGRPCYLTGHRLWEIENGHHDPLTDIFALGLILASLATGLDFSDRRQLECFAGARRDLQRLNSRLHPVLVRAIERMTALERYDRAQDLRSLCDALENYRRIGSDFEQKLDSTVAGKDDRDTAIVKRLRARLYDTSRRNRLLYYRPISGELNLTEASVPLVINPDLIKADDLLTGTSKAMGKLIAGEVLVLGDWIRFEEMLYAPTVLSRLRLDAMRTEQDLGASPLRLIPAMLHWYDLKNAPDTLVTSPLLLLNAQLSKRKGVRDAFVLRIESPQAEVNPALAYVLSQLYGIALPDKVDLSQPRALEDLFEAMKTQILATEPGVSFSLVDKPRRRLLHTTVRRRLDQFQRRQGGRKGGEGKDISDYSYDSANYKPLGVQLFRQRVRIPEAPFRNITGRPLPRYFNLASMSGDTRTEKSRVFVQEVAASEGRFDWSFDSSCVVLGNFNYQKMSLVRDFDTLVETPALRSAHFSKLFDPTPREALPETETDVEMLRNVVPSDPSQNLAIGAAQNGRSLVLQGPPGTGKSQTIANLIANFAGRGERVLFVCQKRAALDVVRNRLAGAGLADLSAVFHDAKTGRAEFLEDLRKLYTQWSDTPPTNTLDRLQRDRTDIIDRLEKANATVHALVDAMSDQSDGEPMHRLIDRALIKGIGAEPSMSSDTGEEQAGSLPSAADWEAWRHAVERALAVLQRMSGGTAFGDMIESRLARDAWQNENLHTAFSGWLSTIEDAVSNALSAMTDLAAQTGEQTNTSSASLILLRDVARYAAALQDLNDAAVIDIARGEQEAGRQFEKDAQALSELARRADRCARLASVWTLPLDPEEAHSALAVAQAEEGRFMARLTSSRLRSINALVAARTDTSGIDSKPTATQLLIWLVEHMKAAEALRDGANAFERRYGSCDPEAIRRSIAAATGKLEKLTPETRSAADRLAGKATTKAQRGLAAMTGMLDEASAAAQLLFGRRASAMPLLELHHIVQALKASATRIALLVPVLRPLAAAPDSIWAIVNGTDADADVDAIDRRILTATLARLFDRHPVLHGIDLHTLAFARVQIAQAQAELDRINAEILTTGQMRVFRNDVVLSNRFASGLVPEERKRREQVLSGRRILENEFAKSRAFRSVRDLVQDESGLLISTIKPIWLMSPLSVADIVPLQNDVFDVVIFDEASQITVEEALPACVRARQIIVVGDSKQLPPTRFFSTAGQDEDFDDEDHDFELDQDSFLTLADEKMPSVMLRWHYRSRHENLIAFSNTAFYDRRLLSIPAPRLPGRQNAIVIPADGGHEPDADTVLSRALGFHHLPHGIYSARSNEVEADYVAKLLRSILMRETDKTIGVVAFSEAQQGQIEGAIAQLAEDDEAFAQRVAKEQERYENGEYVGLFIKNLENVQGDERDIIIVSVCYGRGVSRKMRMNFGPINKVGGEKRLNVIFSRARHHMAIVSSIVGDDITNDYNTGALALKTMLRFAEASSAGHNAEAERVLDRYRTESGQGMHAAQKDSAVAALASWLEDEIGMTCDIGVGLSDFVIDIVPQAPAGQTLSGKPLAILIDSSALYDCGAVGEMLTNRASVLESAGWEVLTVPLKDIWRRPQDVQAALRGILTPKKVPTLH